MRWRPLLPWFAALALVLAFLAIQGRYAIRGNPRGGIYRMDRWTGEVVFISGSRSHRVLTPEETQAEDASVDVMTTEPMDLITEPADWPNPFLESFSTEAPAAPAEPPP